MAVLLLTLALASPVSAQVSAPDTGDVMFRQFAPGLLARVNYQTDSAGAYRVAIWDLLVGPGKMMESPVALPGAGVFEVRSGSGRIEVDGKARDLRGGITFAVDQGSRFALSNGRDDAALAIRVTLIAAVSP
jgi:hypothetical protein